MAHYLIEFRFQSKRIRTYLKGMINELNRKFHVGKRKHIPHISLVGPFTTHNEKRLLSDFGRICSQTQLMKFKGNGFDTFDNNRVVFVKIMSNERFNEFRVKLSKTLKEYCKLPAHNEREEKDKFGYHSTLAMNLNPKEFNSIKNYIKNKSAPDFTQIVMRVTLLRNGRILREYDFMQRRLLNRRQALNKYITRRSKTLLKEFMQGKYNPNKRVESLEQPKKKSFFKKIKEIFRKPKTFIISDLHLDHTNIIKYCKRPFLNIQDMNKILINNWNNTISNKDTVYFLGDLAYGIGSNSTDHWLKKLNGKVIFIKGNHDKSDKIKLYETYILEYAGYKFFLTHEPENIPKDWDGWAICGHHHNNKPQDYPFIDKKNKRINISVELTKYKPVDMNYIIKKIEK